ncbi:MAG TPA: ABC transporter substrate-binding protein [Candidatus Binatia bacterium]|nr:ABC transporter substrate-binding protein [Candidatus Binatia bacterium]
MSRITRTLALIGSITLLAACSSPAASPATTTDPTTGDATPEATTECARENLEVSNEGRLTIGTGNPAYPPYFDFPADDEEAANPANQEDPWALGDPTNGRGFEAAVAYAIAEQLGFSEDEVDWIAVEWEDSWAPGPKDFDFNLNQTSYRPERAEQVDMSEGYYFLNQALVANAGTPIEEATTIEDLREYRLGAQIGTTSLAYIEDVIQPNEEPSVYDDNEAAIAGLDAEQIDGIVVDLPTAFFITAAQMDNGAIVGQFPPADGEQEYFSVVMELDSPLTDCVNESLADLEDDGTLDDITQEWLADRADAPLIGN